MSPSCKCHGEPMMWQKDARLERPDGGWRCRIKFRDANREASRRWRAKNPEYGNIRHARRTEGGQPTNPHGPQYRGDRIGYQQAHSRVRYERGRAAGFACTECGNPAKDWALHHDAPAENLRVDQHTVLAGKVFSLDTNDYSPKCASCNKKDGKFPRELLKTEVSYG